MNELKNNTLLLTIILTTGIVQCLRDWHICSN